MSTDPAQLDHLVVAAATLDEGVRWCEATFGIRPEAGGQHKNMGTHNRLLRIDSEVFPKAYLEIIAIDPVATRPQHARWFDMDDPALQWRLLRDGPQLAHFVARVPDVHAALAAWHALNIERGEAIAASRATPQGLLQWQISVRHDGQRLFDGCLPTLIEWRDAHPCEALPGSGLSLQRLEIDHPQSHKLDQAFHAVGLKGIALQTGPASLRAWLDTPEGTVCLGS